MKNNDSKQNNTKGTSRCCSLTLELSDGHCFAITDNSVCAHVSFLCHVPDNEAL